MNENLIFMAGLPRSGTSLLMNLMGQNRKFHPTATSGLISTVVDTRNNWHDNSIYKSWDADDVTMRMKSLIKWSMLGFYEKELKEGKIPIDKNRGWLAYVDLLEDIFQKRVKIIFPVRRIIDVLGSFEKLHRKSPIIPKANGSNWVNEQTVIGRATNKLTDEGVVGLPILRFREGIFRNHLDRICIVPFNGFTNNTQTVMDYIHDFLGMEGFRYDPNNVEQITYENDLMHGYGYGHLHNIKPKIQPVISNPEEIYSQTYIKKIDNDYKDIQDIIDVLDNDFMPK